MRHKEKAKLNPCRTYWGSHACRKQRGHLGNHRCLHGCPHPEKPVSPAVDHWTLYGEDAHG